MATLKHRLNINVTQKDIDRADKFIYEQDKSHALYCPVALAVKRLMPAGLTVYVVSEDIEVFDGNITLGSYSLPEEAQDFIAGYDMGCGPGPLKFRSDLL